MNNEWTSRTEMLLGKGAPEKLNEKHVAVFGLGGVGGFAVEALSRAGIGALTLVDSDLVAESNLNRQIIATRDTIGMKKTEAMKNRVLSVNPACKIFTFPVFFLPETKDDFDFGAYDYVLDCIDTVSGKIALAEACKKAGTPIIMAMGAGNKLDPTRFEVADISKTSVCPLAKVIRKELKDRGITEVKVVYSKEEPVLRGAAASDPESGKRIPGSVSFVPSVMGLIMAGEVIKDLLG